MDIKRQKRIWIVNVILLSGNGTSSDILLRVPNSRVRVATKGDVD